MTEIGGWNAVALVDCLAPVSVAGKSTVQKRDYKTSGRFPVVDQSQEPIAGWTDDANAVIDAPLPLIVFGDHTRNFKYVDYPFARGADGTQLLKPKANIDPLFFFYACRSIGLEARGYNRHFTILKQKEIRFPSDVSEQIAIGLLLRKTEIASINQSILVAATKDLKHAAMQQLFTRGLRSEAPQQSDIGPVPASWKIVPLEAASQLSTGTTPATSRADYYQGDIPFIKTSEIVNNRISGATTRVSREAVHDYGLQIYPPGTILMAMYGQGKTRGQVGLLEVDAATTQNAAAIEPAKDIDPAFLWHYLLSIYERLRGMGSLGHVSHLNLGYLRKLLVIKPTLLEQKEIAQILDAIDHKIDLHRKKGEVLEQLLKALLHKLMTCEVRVDQIDLSTLKVA
jgi:type I restriction enzyme, S subunit